MENRDLRESVVITGIDIPFWDLVKLQVKFAVAALPAALVLVAVLVFFAGLMNSLVGKR